MRTKTLLCAAALAAGVASSMAQVYSLNVVGYVNVKFPAGSFTVFVNPLNTTNNAVSNLFKANTPDSSFMFDWSSGANDWNSPITFAGGSWDAPTTQIRPGHGWAFFNADFGTDFTNTFVGDVIQGPYTNALAGDFQFSVIGSPVPIGGNFTNAIAQLGEEDGDFFFTWSPVANDWNSPNSYAGGVWDTPGYQVAPADGFAYFRGGSPKNWVRNFTVP